MKTDFTVTSSTPLYLGAMITMKSRSAVLQDVPDRAVTAHILRRTGFGPAPGQVEAWDGMAPEKVLEIVLDNDAEAWRTEAELFDGVPSEGGLSDLFPFLVDQLLDPANPLHERMSWYWHTHFTSSVEAAEVPFVWRQFHLLRKHALGNFGELARSVTTDAAMLAYLDGGDSIGAAPNENYAREFLELFTLGRDNGYTEEDVRVAARIFSGWSIDWDTGQTEYEPELGYTRPLTFMGERRRWDVDSLVAFVCGLPQCHRHVATRLYRHLVGGDPSDERASQLATVFAAAKLEIRPLVREILRGEDFLNARWSRARQPFEWALAAIQAIGLDVTAEGGLELWHLEMLGQAPYLPPNVAGWPLDERWVSASQIITRTSILLDWEIPEKTIEEVAPTAEAVLARCAIFAPSSTTLGALEGIERDVPEYERRLELLFVTALTSPEFFQL